MISWTSLRRPRAREKRPDRIPQETRAMGRQSQADCTVGLAEVEQGGEG